MAQHFMFLYAFVSAITCLGYPSPCLLHHIHLRKSDTPIEKWGNDILNACMYLVSASIIHILDGGTGSVVHHHREQ